VRAAPAPTVCVMELLDGWDLETLVREHGPLPPERVVFLLDQVCDSLDDAHAAGLVHRDVKPANLFLTRRGRRFDFVKVLDFGLARPIEGGAGDTRDTRGHALAGTPAYMAPEIFAGLPPDARSDLYAVGCVAYWLLTGERVFEATEPAALAAAHLHESPVRPSERIELPLPASLERIVLACLAKDPADRPPSALELESRLRACSISPPWTVDRAREWWSRYRPPTVRPGASLASTETRVLYPRD
jgi:serine/threonine protein kinase